MTDWLLAKPTRLLWLCLWVQVIVSASLLTMGVIPWSLLVVIPFILGLIWLKRKGIV